MLKRLIPLIILLILPTASATAQWQSVAPSLIGTGPYNNSGAMTYSDGVVWAGLYNLYKSTDNGLTWQQVSLPNAGSNNIHGIAFYDRNNGAVCGEQGVYITHDQGQTWKTFFGGQAAFYATFSGSPNAYIVGGLLPATSFTTDDGVSWNTHYFPRVTKDFYSVSPGHVIAFVESYTDSHIAETTDYGVTWTERAGTMECDSHSFGVLKCDQSVIFGINEEGGNYGQDNRLSEIYLSTDGGGSFTSIQQFSLATLSGCIAVTPGAVYVPAHTTGILESTDVGKTWTTIPGPDVPIDSRDLISIDDTIMLAADIQGTIWRTVRHENAGSGSSKASHFQAVQQFHPDTTAPCGRMPTKVYLYTASCANRQATLDTASISGSYAFWIDGSSASSRQLSTVDSLIVYFDPTKSGLDTARLTIGYTLNGSRLDTVMLLIDSGFTDYTGTTYSKGTLNVATNTQFNVPISVAIAKVSNISKRRVFDITYKLSFDPAVVSLPGSNILSLVTPPAGWTVLSAATTGSTATVTLQNLAGVQLADSIYLGTLQFTTGSTARKSGLLTTTSVTLSTDSGIMALCFFTEGDFIANVVLGGAGVSPISPVSLHFTMNPNPVRSNGTLFLHWNASHVHSPEIELFDLLGRSVDRVALGSATNGSFDLALPQLLPSGTYYLRFSSGSYVETRTFEVLR